MAQQVRPIDVAEFVLEQLGQISAMKLQKLLYYSQAWSLAWTDKELFEEDFEAWANGPVLKSVFKMHKGHFRVEPGFFGGDSSRLSGEQKAVIKKVLMFYGAKDPQWLSQLTHIEMPWKTARIGIPDGESCSKKIPKETIQDYYANL